MYVEMTTHHGRIKSVQVSKRIWFLYTDGILIGRFNGMNRLLDEIDRQHEILYRKALQRSFKTLDRKKTRVSE